MDGDADDPREGVARGRTLQEVLVPVGDLPVRRRRPGDAGQGERGGQDVLAETGVGVLGVERIEQQSELGSVRTGSEIGVETGRDYWLANQSFAVESIVVVLAHRSCETIVAFIGILKANLAYMPLDIKAPSARLETILKSTDNCNLVLLGSKVSPLGIASESVRFVPISDVVYLQIQSITNTRRPSATSLAYVMFTSGSTGKPKGIMIHACDSSKPSLLNEAAEPVPPISLEFSTSNTPPASLLITEELSREIPAAFRVMVPRLSRETALLA